MMLVYLVSDRCWGTTDLCSGARNRLIINEWMNKSQFKWVSFIYNNDNSSEGGSLTFSRETLIILLLQFPVLLPDVLAGN